MAALAAGMAAAGAGAEPPPAELVALVAAAVAALLAAVGSPALGAAGAVLLVVGATVGQARVQAIEAPGDAIAGGASVQAKATILGPPRPSAFGSSAELEIDTGPAAGARLVARASDDLEWPPAAPPGSEVRVRGYAQPAEEDPGADFDWPGYLRRRGIAGELELEAVRATGGRRGGLLGAVDSARGRAERALAERATHSQAALIRGMVLGQDQAIDPLLRDDFRAAGLAHILAVSGQNVVLLALLATPVLAALGLGPRGRVLAVLALIALYVPLAGAGPSLQRAGIMGAAGLVALALGRPASRWYGLLVASAATLALNPRGCGEAGWQLSFAAVAGILAIAPLIRPALGWLPRPLSEGVALTVSATVATAPLLAHHFDQVSIASLPANLVALPAVAPAMWIGMVQVALGQLFSAGDPLAGLATTLATWLGAVNGVLLDYLAALARRAAETPWAEAAVDFDSPSEVAAAYLAIAAVAMAIARISRRLGPATAAFAGLSAAWWRTRSRAARAAAAIVLAALALALAGVGAARVSGRRS